MNLLWTMFLWGVLAPAAAALAVLLASLAWRRPEQRDRQRTGKPPGRAAGLPGALAVGAGFVAAHLGLAGGPGLGIEGGLLTVALLGSGWAALEALAPLPASWLWPGRLGLSVAVAWVMMQPLAAPQGWSAAHFGLMLVPGAAVVAMAWTALDRFLGRTDGLTSAVAAAALAASSAGVVVLGGMAAAGQLLGGLAAALGSVALLAWRSPGSWLLQGAAAPLSVLLAAHWGAAALYGSLPLASLALLSAAPLALLATGVSFLRRTGRAALLAAALGLAVLPVGAAALPAALEYFAIGSRPPSSGGPACGPATCASAAPQDDYGY